MISTMAQFSPAGRRVADLCTGTGAIALAAAAAGASSVAAFDLSPAAVECARANAVGAQLNVDVHLGSWARATEYGPFDLVVCNPPYVPAPPNPTPVTEAPALSYNGGPDGRLVVDPLCEYAPALLAPGGTMLIVHSECTGVAQTIAALRAQGLSARTVARQRIPFGPVMRSRAEWLLEQGLIAEGQNHEWISVICGVKPVKP